MNRSKVKQSKAKSCVKWCVIAMEQLDTELCTSRINFRSIIIINFHKWHWHRYSRLLKFADDGVFANVENLDNVEQLKNVFS